MPRERRGVRDGSDRIAAVARWLDQCMSQRKANLASLHLLQRSEDEWFPIAQWLRDTVTEELAIHISDLAQDAADEACTHLQLRLQWRDKDGGVTMQKQLRAWPSKSTDAGILEQLDGTHQSQLQQTQRHLEAANQTIVMMARQQDERWTRIFEAQAQMMDRVVSRLDLVEEAYDRTKAEAAEAMQLADEATAAAEEAAQRAEEAEQSDKFSKVVEIGMRQIAANGSQPPKKEPPK